MPQPRFEAELPKYKSQALLLESTGMARQQDIRIEQNKEKLQYYKIIARCTGIKINHFGIDCRCVKMRAEYRKLNPRSRYRAV